MFYFSRLFSPAFGISTPSILNFFPLFKPANPKSEAGDLPSLFEFSPHLTHFFNLVWCQSESIFCLFFPPRYFYPVWDFSRHAFQCVLVEKSPDKFGSSARISK